MGTSLCKPEYLIGAQIKTRGQFISVEQLETEGLLRNELIRRLEETGRLRGRFNGSSRKDGYTIAAPTRAAELFNLKMRCDSHAPMSTTRSPRAICVCGNARGVVGEGGGREKEEEGGGALRK